MHTLYVIAFLLFTFATIYSLFERAWVWALLTAGLACYVAPVAFQLAA